LLYSGEDEYDLAEGVAGRREPGSELLTEDFLSPPTVFGTITEMIVP
jgi:hypothetical protein